jgi:hypothetical protein
MDVTSRAPAPMFGATLVLAAALLLAVLPAARSLATTAEDEPPTIRGSVTIDGTPAPAGTVIVGESVTAESGTPIRCGEATVADDGSFQMTLANECSNGMSLSLRLAEIDLTATQQIDIPADDIDNVLVRFERPPVGDASQIGATLAEPRRHRQSR